VRFVVYGAGAVGGVLGARLSAAGQDVVLVARGRHLAAIRRDGLRVQSPDGERTHRITAVAGPDEIRWQAGDVVLLAMKSMDTYDAVRALARHADPATPVVCVQNAVANERTALRSFAHVYGVCVMFPSGHLEPGVVQAHCSPVPGILDIGRYPAGTDAFAARVSAAFQDAGFHSEPRPDIMRRKYTKLLMNLGNAVQAVCGPVDGLADAVRPVRAEGHAVLAAAGIAYASDAEDKARRGDILQIRPIAGQSRGGGSSWQSLHRRTGSVEADYLNGEIVLLGRLHGVPTPANELARRLANRYARDRVPPGAMTPERFLAMLADAPAEPPVDSPVGAGDDTQ
jgi:2-dehydropantoate 2-reductase